MKTNFLRGERSISEFTLCLHLLLITWPSIQAAFNDIFPPYPSNYSDEYRQSNMTSFLSNISIDNSPDSFNSSSLTSLTFNSSSYESTSLTPDSFKSSSFESVEMLTLDLLNNSSFDSISVTRESFTSPTLGSYFYNYTDLVNNSHTKLGFTATSRFQTVTRTTSLVSVVIERSGNADSVAKVSYHTRELSKSHRMAGVRIDPALAGSDFQAASGIVTLDVGQRLRVIDIHLFPQRSVRSSQPRMFQVILHSPSQDIELDPSASEANITIVEGVEAGRLWDIMSLVWSSSLKDVILEYALEQLDEEIVNEQLDISISVIGDILDRILEEGKKRTLSNPVIHGLMSVFCKLMDPVRSDTQGNLYMIILYHKFASVLLTNVPCPTPQFITLHDCPFSKIAAAFLYENKLNGIEFHGLYRDTIKLPQNMFPNVFNESICRRVFFIEYNSAKWFFKASDKLPLSNRILSLNVEGKEFSQLESPVIFRIHTMDSRIQAKQAECLYFDEKKDFWLGSSKSDSCQLLKIVQDAVFCSCSYLSMYAARAELLAEHLVGYNMWFYGSSVLAIIGLTSAILAHHLCSIYSMFSASLLMHMVFAVLANQIIYFINVIVSPTILLDDSNISCTILGFFQHYFFLAQFSWMFSQAINFWKIFIRNDEHTHCHYAYFFFLGWGSPAVIVSIFYVITYNLYQHISHLQDQSIYGDIHNNGQICFITNSYAALVGVIIPILVFLVIISAVFMQAYQVSGQWQCFDDIYRGRYNGPEVRILFIFWAIIMLSWFWGGLHLAYGHLWMLVLFCLFTSVQGLYALIVYTILRNPRLPCLFRPTKATYTVNSIPESISTEPLTQPVVRQRNKLSVSEQTWSRANLSTGGMKVIRSPPPTIDPMLLFQSQGEKVPPLFIEPDTKEFDDLIFALKTGTTFMAQAIVTNQKSETPNFDPDVSLFSAENNSLDTTYDTHL